jgi:hypothetical protein
MQQWLRHPSLLVLSFLGIYFHKKCGHSVSFLILALCNLGGSTLLMFSEENLVLSCVGCGLLSMWCLFSHILPSFLGS